MNDEKCKCSCNLEEKSRNDKNLTIDFLYLDLSACERCQQTETTIREGIEDVENILEEIGYSVSFTKIHIQSKEAARNHAFLSSPTIRINGRDIVLKNRESSCSSCGDYCGTEVDCRDWEWDGRIYNSPPKGMIIDAILKAVYDKDFGQPPDFKNYEISENIKKFFDSKEKKKESMNS